MAHGVHAAVHVVEAADRLLMVDRSAAETKLEQLSPGDYAVLTGGSLRYGGPD